MNTKTAKLKQPQSETEDKEPNDIQISLRLPTGLFEKLEQRRIEERADLETRPFIRQLLNEAVQQPVNPEIPKSRRIKTPDRGTSNTQLDNTDEPGRNCLDEIDELRAVYSKAQESLESQIVDVKEALEFIYFELIDLLMPNIVTAHYQFSIADENSAYAKHITPEIEKLKRHFRNRLLVRNGHVPIQEEDLNSAKTEGQGSDTQKETRKKTENHPSDLEKEIPF